MRTTVQLSFFVLVVTGVFVVGGNAERWCPFGGAEAIYTYVHEGNLPCSLQVSNLFILAGVLVGVLLVRRAFCGYACPIGALSEWSRSFGKRIGLGGGRTPRGLDGFLSLLKYGVLVLLLYLTWTLGELVFRGYDPCYALLSRHGEDITTWAYVVGGGVLLGSVFVSLPFCRWLCPLGALLNPFSRFGLWRVRRNDEACSSCGFCSDECPMAIPIHEVTEVRHARCTACMRCTDACPHAKREALTAGPSASHASRWPRPVVVGILLLTLAAPVAAALLFPLPAFRWQRGEEPAETRVLEMQVEGLGCRGKANLLKYFLTRDDDLELEGYLALDAWPGPGASRANIRFDSAKTDEDAIRMAITQPYFEEETRSWRHSPFSIAGYDPLGP